MRTMVSMGLLLLTLASGCAIFAPNLEAPEAMLVDVKPLEEGGALEQRFELSLRLQNPNEDALELDGIDLRLEVNGVPLGRAVSGESFVIPRLGETVVTLNAVTTVFDLLRQLANAPTATGLSYKLRGRVFLASSLARLSFERSGELSGEAPGR